MPRYSSSFLFPDTNVWLALSYQRHIHHSVATKWFTNLPDSVRICFCRFTQIGLLRLLTTDAVMGKDGCLTQVQAWDVYDRWLEDDRIMLAEEPADLDGAFRNLSRQVRPAPKDWADSYLAAFASVAGSTLVTLDSAISARAENTLLLRT
jgi:uncharacterized protein